MEGIVCKHLLIWTFFCQSTFTFWNIYRKSNHAWLAGVNKNSYRKCLIIVVLIWFIIVCKSVCLLILMYNSYFVYRYGVLIEILMVSVLLSSVVDRVFESRMGKTIDYNIGQSLLLGHSRYPTNNLVCIRRINRTTFHMKVW